MIAPPGSWQGQTRASGYAPSKQEVPVAVPEGFDPARRWPVMIYDRGNWEEGRRFTFRFTSTFEMWNTAMALPQPVASG